MRRRGWGRRRAARAGAAPGGTFRHPRVGVRRGASPAAYGRLVRVPGTPGTPGTRDGARPSPCHGIEIPPWRRIRGGPCMRPPRRCPAPPRAPGAAPIPSAGPIPGAARAGHGHRNTSAVDPKPWCRSRRPDRPGSVRPARPGRAATRPAPAPFSLSLSFRFLPGPAPAPGAGAGAAAPAPLAPAPFAPLAFRRWHYLLAPRFRPSSARAADVAHALRGEVRRLHVPPQRVVRALRVVSSPSSACSADHRRRTGWCPSSFCHLFCDAFGRSPPIRRSRRGRPGGRGSRRVFSCVSVVVTDVPSLFPRATGGGPVGMGSPSLAPPPGTCSAPWTCRRAPRSSSLSLGWGLGWEGQRARDARRVRTTRWPFGCGVRSRRRRSVGGRERRVEPPDGAQKASPRVSSTARNKRRAFRRSTAVVPAATPQHRSRGTRVDSLFRTPRKSKMARQNARVGGCRRRRERTVTARRRCAPSSVTFPTRAASRAPKGDTHREWPAPSGGRAYTTLRFTASEALFEEDLFASKVFFAPSRDLIGAPTTLKLDFDERRR